MHTREEHTQSAAKRSILSYFLKLVNSLKNMLGFSAGDVVPKERIVQASTKTATPQGVGSRTTSKGGKRNPYSIHNEHSQNKSFSRSGKPINLGGNNTRYVDPNPGDILKNSFLGGYGIHTPKPKGTSREERHSVVKNKI